MSLANKRVALCFSGQARSAKACLSSITEAIMAPWQSVDVFIHSWFIDSDSSNHFDILQQNIYDCRIDEYLKMYNPVACVLEDFQRTKYVKYTNLKDRCKIMFYSIYRCDELRQQYEIENGAKYDYVIRCRPDLKFERPIQFDDIANLDDNSILIQKNDAWNGLNDQFAVGKPFAMRKYASVHEHLNRYLTTDNQQHIAEIVLKHHINAVGLKLKLFDFSYSIAKR